MKRLTIAVASLFTAAAPLAQAAYDRNGNYYDPRDFRGETARVIESRPVYEAANTREECWNPRAGHFEERRDSHTSIGKGAAIGAVAGGVLGHQIERQENKQDDLDLSRCRTVASGDSGAILGYDVRYRYRGEEYTARMAQDPGRRLRLGEDIRTDGTPYDSAYSTPSYSQNEPYSYDPYRR